MAETSEGSPRGHVSQEEKQLEQSRQMCGPSQSTGGRGEKQKGGLRVVPGTGKELAVFHIRGYKKQKGCREGPGTAEEQVVVQLRGLGSAKSKVDCIQNAMRFQGRLMEEPCVYGMN